MEVTWEVEDGYAGKSRPQTTYIPDEEFEGVETESEKQEIIERFVEKDFNEKIDFYIQHVDE